MKKINWQRGALNVNDVRRPIYCRLLYIPNTLDLVLHTTMRCLTIIILKTTCIFNYLSLNRLNYLMLS